MSMKSFTFLRGFLSLILIAFIMANSALAQTATITVPAAATTTITAGQTVTFTATRSGNFPGSGDYFFDWLSSPAAGVSFAPATQSGPGLTTSTTVATFSTTGTFSITCSVHQSGAPVVTAPKTVIVNAAAPANLWGTTSSGTQISSFTVSNGSLTNGPTNLFAPTFPGATNTYTRTAALGRNASPSPANGFFYWLGSSSGGNQNDGLVEVFAANANGSTIAKIGQLDLNGAGNGAELGFVRLGMGPDGTGWILAGDGTTLYLAKFASNGVNPVSIVLEDNSVTLSGGTVPTFQNGDLCISGNNNIYALANDGSGVTQIFIGAPNGNSTTLTKKWDLVDPSNTPFTGSVNGVAFDLLGSLYISTADGLYYIDQATVNGPAGTVECSLVSTLTGVQDLASNVFPTQSTLPVTLLNFSASYKNGVTTVSWETENEVSFSHYEVERRSASGGSGFVSVASKIAQGNTGKSTYTYPDNISALSDNVVYYRLKMVDKDGHFKYSSVIMVRKEQKMITGIMVSPNPVIAGDVATLRFEASASTIVTFRVVDMAGRVISSQQNRVNEGMNSIPVNNLDRLQPGIYIIQMQNGEELTAIKLSVVR
jgi:Secretion system C-terminal sorting domain